MKTAGIGRGRHWAALLVISMVASMLTFNMALPAWAIEGFQLDIPINTVVTAGVGTETELARADVPPEYVGQQCTVTSIGQNQESVHPNNDLIVSSGGSQVVVPNVERSPEAITVAEDSLVLGSEVVVVLRMGPDGVFSAGLVVEIDCQGDTAGRIVVVKEVTDGSDTSQEFGFEASYDSDGFSLSDGESDDSGELDPGTYAVSESVPQGWSLLSAVCDDDSTVDAIEVSAGETVTCTFTNDEMPPPPTDVGASIVPTVAGECLVVEGQGQGVINVVIPIDGGATVVISDAGGEIETFTSDGSINVTAGATYTWEATPNDGFEFPPGFTASGTITIEDCTPTPPPPPPSPDEVMASILVTVDGTCEDGDGFVGINLSVDGGATVVVTDADGDVMGRLSSDGTITVPEGATYNWVATPSEGFEFPADFASSGTISVVRCSDPETLPFTGMDLDVAAAFAAAFLGAGITVLVSQWRREEQ